MLGEVSACLAALKTVNSAISIIKQSTAHASDISGVLGHWANAQEKFQKADKARASGRLSYKEAIALETAARQLKNFDQQLKDICYLQQQPDLYHSIKNRIEISRVEHEKAARKLRIKRAQNRKLFKEIFLIVSLSAFGFFIIMGILYLYVRIF